MYQERDHEIIDYQLYALPETPHLVRGPAPDTLHMGRYFTCLGAAQTFGCFCERPYPALLAESLRLSALNLGFAGAGPRFFLDQQPLLEYANRGQFAVVQVMAARSEDNSLFDTGGLEYLTRREDGLKLGAEPAYRELLESESTETVKGIVDETRQNWIESYRSLFRRLEVPTILFWFSTRAPQYDETYADVWGLFGEFPQLVNRDMLEAIKPFAQEYVECISSRGLPQPLISRFTNQPVSIRHRADLGDGWEGVNPYYPSPAMHSDAFEALAPSCRRLVGAGVKP